MAKPVHVVKFPLGHQTIDILFVRTLKDPDNPTEQLYGFTDVSSGHIKINLKLHNSIDHLLATCFHELIHAYIDITGHNIHFDPDTEEALVKMLEAMLFWLVDKKLLTELLKAEILQQYFVPTKERS